jgi:hypothetical protein
MGIDAVAVLHLPFEDVTRELEPHEPAEGTYRSLGGSTVRIVALGDATLVHTMGRFGAEPDELGLTLRWLLGGLVDRHADERGIFVFPDVAAPKASGYHALIEELGEVGFWTPRVAADHVPERLAQAEPGSLEAAVRDMMAALPPGALADLGRAAAGIDPGTMARAAQQLQAALGGGDPQLTAALGQSLGTAQQLLAATGRGPGAPMQQGLAGLPFDIPDEQQAPELWRKAREQAEALLQDPARFAELSRTLGLALPRDPTHGPTEPTTEPAANPRGKKPTGV